MPTAPSYLHLPAGPWSTVLDCLCARFPAVEREQWLSRMRRGLVQDEQGRALGPEAAYREGLRVRYFREVASEPVIPFELQILHRDEHLLVVDKPHFLAVAPAGQWVEQTALARLQAELGNAELAPLHRLDRLTAGVLLFSCRADSRDAYQRLFRERRIDKTYEALAPALPELAMPHEARHRLVPGEPFFRMQAVAGEPNCLTLIEVLERGQSHWLYRLQPHSGRKHQLRVQMAALGAPILGDPLYPQLQPEGPDDFARPLQLLARELRFVDPLTGQPRRFSSRRTLA